MASDATERSERGREGTETSEGDDDGFVMCVNCVCDESKIDEIRNVEIRV